MLPRSTYAKTASAPPHTQTSRLWAQQSALARTWQHPRRTQSPRRVCTRRAPTTPPRVFLSQSCLLGGWPFLRWLGALSSMQHMATPHPRQRTTHPSILTRQHTACTKPTPYNTHTPCTTRTPYTTHTACMHHAPRTTHPNRQSNTYTHILPPHRHNKIHSFVTPHYDANTRPMFNKSQLKSMQCPVYPICTYGSTVMCTNECNKQPPSTKPFTSTIFGMQTCQATSKSCTLSGYSSRPTFVFGDSDVSVFCPQQSEPLRFLLRVEPRPATIRTVAFSAAGGA